MGTIAAPFASFGYSDDFYRLDWKEAPSSEITSNLGDLLGNAVDGILECSNSGVTRIGIISPKEAIRN